jgi:hypothetical protein
MNAKQQPSNLGWNFWYYNKLFTLSVYLADTATSGISDKVQIIDFDIPDAFLHNKLTRKDTNGIQLTRKDTNGIQLIEKLPKGLPSPYGNILQPF